jgi:hypothetical protein
MKLEATIRKAALGKPRDEARDILIAEYNRHGKDPPGQPFLDRRLDMILAPNTPIDRAVRGVEDLTAIAGAGHRLMKFLQGFPRTLPPVLRQADIILIPDYHQTSRVVLDKDAQSWLGQVETVALTFRDMSHIGVNLRATAPRFNGGEIKVSVADRDVGVLSDADSDPYWQVLTETALDQTVVASTIAVRTRDTDGSWRLDLGAPKDTIDTSFLREEDLPED